MTKASDITRETPPTDEELMLFVDGELDGARLEEVAAFAEEDASARSKVAALHLAGSLLRDTALSSGVADGIADAVMAKIESSNSAGKVVSLRPLGEARPKASNDNARRIFTFAAVAIAAAAAFALWGRPHAGPPSMAVAQKAPPAAVAGKPADTAAEPTRTLPESEGPGVEVAAVNFGTKSGSIFYVPSGASSSAKTTAVVWINDDSAGVP